MNAIFPGSFDPLTLGHVNIAQRSSAFVDKLVVAVLDNPHKSPLFSTEERVMLLKEFFKEDANIEVEAFSGLLVDYAVKKGINVIIRGVRGPEDLSKELPYAKWNHDIASSSIETIYMPTAQDLSHISSSIIKEIAAYDITKIANTVPHIVYLALKAKYST